MLLLKKQRWRLRALGKIHPTAEQLPILADSGTGFRVIRGAAGSGKTTTAILRLRQLCAARISRQRRLGSQEPVRVLVLTFNRTLRGYVMELVQEQIAGQEGVDITLETFGHWALTLVGPRRILEPGESRGHLARLLRRVGISRNVDYFVDEIEYIMGRFLPAERIAYLNAERTGRGRAPAIPRSLRVRLLSEVVEPYAELKTRDGLFDWSDIAVEAASMGDHRYDVVVVDETQDLSANQVRAILRHLHEDHSTTFIIDAMQRIYPQSFRWQEVDIVVRPQIVYTLSENHRNTSQTACLASSLVADMTVEEDGVRPDAQSCRRSGEVPHVVVGRYSAQLQYMLDRVLPFLEAGETVAILQPRGGGWFDFAKQALRERQIDYCVLTRNPDWPSGAEQVALSTLHSAKGLEFDHVLLPGLNSEVTPHGDEEGDGVLDALRRLVAMGIGRARRNVIIGYKPREGSSLVKLFPPDAYTLVNV